MDHEPPSSNTVQDGWDFSFPIHPPLTLPICWLSPQIYLFACLHGHRDQSCWLQMFPGNAWTAGEKPVGVHNMGFPNLQGPDGTGHLLMGAGIRKTTHSKYGGIGGLGFGSECSMGDFAQTFFSSPWEDQNIRLVDYRSWWILVNFDYLNIWLNEMKIFNQFFSS